MKKTLAILLALCLSVTAFSSLAMTASADAPNYSMSFRDSTSGADLPTGWEIFKGSATVRDGYLEIAKNSIIALPADLACKDFTLEADFTVELEYKPGTTNVDPSRWVSFMYRTEGENSTDPKPYAQMCIRKNATAANGVEIAYKNTAGSWLYAGRTSANFQVEADQEYTAQVIANGDKVMHSLNGSPLLLASIAEWNTKSGRFCIQTSDYIHAKIYAMRLTATQTLPDKLADGSDKIKTVYEPTTKLVNAPTVIRAVNTADSFSNLTTAAKKTQVAFFLLDGSNEVFLSDGESKTMSEAFTACGSSIIPMFNVSTMASAKALGAYIGTNSEFDLIVASTDTDVLNYFHSMYPKAVRLAYIADGITSDSDLAEIAETALSASASIVALPADLTRKQTEYFQKRFLSVWVAGIDDMTDTEITEAACESGANGILVADQTVPYALYEAAKAEDNILVRRSFVIAHRGLNREAPENSVEAMKLAAEANVDYVECDVYVTKDGELVINHDGKISGYVTDKNAPSDSIENYTKAEIKAYTLKPVGDYTDCKFAFLDELFTVLKDYPDLILNIEIKTGNTNVQSMIQKLAEEMGVEDQIVSIGFSDSQVRLMHETMPIGVSQLRSGLSGKTTTEKIFEVMSLIGPSGASYSPDCYSQNKELMTALSRRGILDNVWTVDGLSAINTYVNMGAASVTTNEGKVISTLYADAAKKLAADYILYGTPEVSSGSGSSGSGSSEAGGSSATGTDSGTSQGGNGNTSTGNVDTGSGSLAAVSLAALAAVGAILAAVCRKKED